MGRNTFASYIEQLINEKMKVGGWYSIKNEDIKPIKLLGPLKPIKSTKLLGPIKPEQYRYKIPFGFIILLIIEILVIIMVISIGFNVIYAL